MTTKALGKKPPSDVCNGDGDSCTPNCICGREWHYRQALIEAAEEMECPNFCPKCRKPFAIYEPFGRGGYCNPKDGGKAHYWIRKGTSSDGLLLAKKLRISAGCEK